MLPNRLPSPSPARSRRAPGPFAALPFALLLLLGALLPAPGALAHEVGERVEVTGLVTGPDGEPVDDVRVTLEQVREGFDFRKFRKAPEKVSPLSTSTDDRGEYRFTFPWDSFYNRYELVAGITIRGTGGRERFVELARTDVTRRLEKSNPAVLSLTLENAGFIRDFRSFLAGLRSADEQRVYREQGKPDRVRSTDYGSRSETTWWYFATGQVYRFVDGRLNQVDRFDPVEPIP